MGCFNKVFKILRSRVFHGSNKDLAGAWTRILSLENGSGQRETINDTTLSRWKHRHAPHEDQLNKLLALLTRLGEERRMKTGKAVFDKAVRRQLIGVLESESPGTTYGAERWSGLPEDEFLAFVLRRSWEIQKNGGPAIPDGGKTRPPVRRWPLVAVTAGALFLSAMVVIFAAGKSAVYQSKWHYIHPLTYAGPVWIKISPSALEAAAVHQVEIIWGEWVYRTQIEFQGRPFVCLMHEKEDDTSTVQLTVSIFPSCSIEFGQGNLESPYCVPINEGWILEP